MSMQIPRLLTRKTCQSFGTRAYHLPPGFKFQTMNDLPVPHGPWKEHYERQQRKYNMHLIGGITIFISTLAIAKFSGLVYLNSSPYN